MEPEDCYEDDDFEVVEEATQESKNNAVVVPTFASDVDGDGYNDDDFCADSAPASAIKSASTAGMSSSAPSVGRSPAVAAPAPAPAPAPVPTPSRGAPVPHHDAGSYDYDDDDDVDLDFEFVVPAKQLRGKKDKGSKPTAKGGKKKGKHVSPTKKVVQSQPYDPDAHSEAENEMRVDKLLEEYNYYPKSVPRTMHTEKEKGADEEVPTAAAATMPSTVADVGRVAVKKSKEVVAKQTHHMASSGRRAVAPAAGLKNNSQPQKPDYDFLVQRVAVLEERERALIDAVEDLSSQNEELIKKLKKAMQTELQLELR